MKINQNKILIIAVFLLTINVIFSEEPKVVEVGKLNGTVVEVGNYSTTEQGIVVTTENAINIQETTGSAVTTSVAIETTTETAISKEKKEEKTQKYQLENYNVVEGTEQKGQATYYAKKFHGNKTTNGEKFSIYKYTGAHRTLKFGTMVKVTNVDNGKSVVVRINDRGPFTKGKIIDLSPVAFEELAKLNKGILNVKIEVLEEKPKNPVIEDKKEIKEDSATENKTLEKKEEIEKNEVKSSN